MLKRKYLILFFLFMQYSIGQQHLDTITVLFSRDKLKLLESFLKHSKEKYQQNPDTSFFIYRIFVKSAKENDKIVFFSEGVLRLSSQKRSQYSLSYCRIDSIYIAKDTLNDFSGNLQILSKVFQREIKFKRSMAEYLSYRQDGNFDFFMINRKNKRDEQKSVQYEFEEKLLKKFRSNFASPLGHNIIIGKIFSIDEYREFKYENGLLYLSKLYKKINFKIIRYGHLILTINFIRIKNCNTDCCSPDLIHWSENKKNLPFIYKINHDYTK